MYNMSLCMLEYYINMLCYDYMQQENSTYRLLSIEV